MGEFIFNGDRVYVREDEKFLEMDSGDGGTTMVVYLMLLNCMLKRFKMVIL